MQRRREIGFVVAILIGLAIGGLIKKVTIGLIIGLILGLFASSLIVGRRDDEKK
jgi:F0F1-type ATP synthase assembly protein I